MGQERSQTDPEGAYPRPARVVETGNRWNPYWISVVVATRAGPSLSPQSPVQFYNEQRTKLTRNRICLRLLAAIMTCSPVEIKK